MFDSKDGYLHLLFANEDHYYLGSLVRLDLSRKLYYILKRDQYRDVFFVQDLKGGCRVKTEDAQSAARYAKDIKKSFGFPVKVERENRQYRIRHKNKEEMTDRILRLFGEENDCYAIVIPIRVFAELFRTESSRQSLNRALREQRQRSIFVITAPLKADVSMKYLLDREGIFNTEVCPEMMRLLARPQRFLLYEELKLELRGRYHVWNQMREKDIRRMLMCGLFFEGWSGDPGRLEDYTDLIYAWYHSEPFSHKYNGILWKNQWRSMEELENQLSGKKCWKILDETIDCLCGELGMEGSLKERIAGQYPLCEEERDPSLDISSSVTRLEQIEIEKLVPETEGRKAEKIKADFYGIRRELLRPWSDGTSNSSSIEFCAGRLKTLAGQREPEQRTVEKILEMMKYSVYSRERERAPKLFQRKIEYYEAMIRIAMDASELRLQIWKEEERLAQEDLRYRRLLDRAKKELAGNQTLPEYGQSVDGEMLHSHAVKLELINAKKDLENKKSIIGTLEIRAAQHYQSVRQLELAVLKLREDNVTATAEELLKHASDLIRQQANQEAEKMRRLREAQDQFQLVREEAERSVLEGMGGDNLDQEYRRLVGIGKEDRDV